MQNKITFDLKNKWDSEVDKGIKIFIDAFHNEPVTNAMIDLSQSKTIDAYHKLIQSISKTFFKNGNDIILIKVDKQVAGIAILSLPDSKISMLSAETFKNMFLMLPHLKYTNIPTFLKTFPLNSTHSKERVTLEILAVDPSHQGKRIGDKLLRFVGEFYKRRGYELYLTTGREQTADYYERYGFKVVGRKSDNKLTVYEMVRKN